jgi:hypothetical protein
MKTSKPVRGDVIILDDGSMVGIERVILGGDQGIWSISDALGRRWLVRPYAAMDNKIAAEFGRKDFHCWQALHQRPETGG